MFHNVIELNEELINIYYFRREISLAQLTLITNYLKKNELAYAYNELGLSLSNNQYLADAAIWFRKGVAIGDRNSMWNLANLLYRSAPDEAASLYMQSYPLWKEADTYNKHKLSKEEHRKLVIAKLETLPSARLAFQTFCQERMKDDALLALSLAKLKLPGEMKSGATHTVADLSHAATLLTQSWLMLEKDLQARATVEEEFNKVTHTHHTDAQGAIEMHLAFFDIQLEKYRSSPSIEKIKIMVEQLILAKELRSRMTESQFLQYIVPRVNHLFDIVYKKNTDPLLAPLLQDITQLRTLGADRSLQFYGKTLGIADDLFLARAIYILSSEIEEAKSNTNTIRANSVILTNLHLAIFKINNISTASMYTFLKDAALCETSEKLNPDEFSQPITNKLAEMKVDYAKYKTAIRLCFDEKATPDTITKGAELLISIASSIATPSKREFIYFGIHCHQQAADAYKIIGDFKNEINAHIKAIYFAQTVESPQALKDFLVVGERILNTKNKEEFFAYTIALLNVIKHHPAVNAKRILEALTHNSLAHTLDWLNLAISSLEKNLSYSNIVAALIRNAAALIPLELKKENIKSLLDYTKITTDIVDRIHYLIRSLKALSTRTDASELLESALDYTQFHTWDAELQKTVASVFLLKESKTTEHKSEKTDLTTMVVLRNFATQLLLDPINMSFSKANLTGIFYNIAASWPQKLDAENIKLFKLIIEFANRNQQAALAIVAIQKLTEQPQLPAADLLEALKKTHCDLLLERQKALTFITTLPSTKAGLDSLLKNNAILNCDTEFKPTCLIHFNNWITKLEKSGCINLLSRTERLAFFATLAKQAALPAIKHLTQELLHRWDNTLGIVSEILAHELRNSLNPAYPEKIQALSKLTLSINKALISSNQQEIKAAEQLFKTPKPLSLKEIKETIFFRELARIKIDSHELEQELKGIHKHESLFTATHTEKFQAIKQDDLLAMDYFFNETKMETNLESISINLKIIVLTMNTENAPLHFQLPIATVLEIRKDAMMRLSITISDPMTKPLVKDFAKFVFELANQQRLIPVMQGADSNTLITALLKYSSLANSSLLSFYQHIHDCSQIDDAKCKDLANKIDSALRAATILRLSASRFVLLPTSGSEPVVTASETTLRI